MPTHLCGLRNSIRRNHFSSSALSTRFSTFTPPQASKLLHLRALERRIPLSTFHIKDFWNVASQQPKEEFVKHGQAWAVQFILYMVRFERRELLAERHDLADPETNKGADYLSDCIENMSVGDGPPPGVTLETFEQPLVQELMTPIDEDVVPLAKEPKEKLVWWMRPSDAVHLLEGEHVKAFGSMEVSLGRMKLLK